MEKLQRIRQKLEAYFKERESVIRGMVVSSLTRDHTLMIGPPGTAKSLLIQKFNGHIKEGRYFQWLLTKFTTPEEIFGPYSLAKLSQDRYERVGTGKMQEAHHVFLDEVYNANSSILNALNEVMNEHTFNGEPVKLECLYGATNFIAEEKATNAFHDRWLFRFIVDYISADKLFQEMLQGGDMAIDPDDQISVEDLHALQARVSEVSITPVLKQLSNLRGLLKKEQIIVSDRRWVKCLNALRAYALIDGRDACRSEDLYILEDILWTEKHDIPRVSVLVMKNISPAWATIQEHFKAAIDVESSLKKADPDKPEDLAKFREGVQKLKGIQEAIARVEADSVLSPRETKATEKIITQLDELINATARKMSGI